MTPASIVQLLERELGLDVASVGQRAIDAAVDRRVAALGITVARYATSVRAVAGELDALIDELVVPETWFFRDGAPFALLAKRAVERTATTKLRPFRVLSMPCSSGEEPYSVAIALLEAGLRPGQFTIDAFDVSSRNVETTRAATYGKSSFRGGPPFALASYLEPAGDKRRVTKVVRDAVKVARGNILDPKLLAGALRYDVILCRNLLIYLTTAARKQALDLIESALYPDGIVIAGHAESLEMLDPRFVAVPAPGAFAFTRGDGVRRVERISSPILPIVIPPIVEDAPEPEPVVEPALTLEVATALANRGELDAAHAACDRLIARGSPTAAHYALLGVVQHGRGDHAAAERAFTQALYLDPQHLETLIQLSLLLRRRGQIAAADQLIVRADRVRGQR